MVVSIQATKPEVLSKKFVGDASFEATSIAGLSEADETSITFYRGEDLDQLANLKVGILIVSESLEGKVTSHLAKAVVFVDHPKYHWVKVISDNYKNTYEEQNSKVLNPKAKVSEQATLESNVTLGDNTQIYPQAVVAKDSILGNNVEVQYGSVIGGIGLGDVWYNGAYHKFVHLGRVVIEDNVSIGVNVTVLKGMIEDTVIGEGTKIGNNVNIGHNVTIGKNCYISSGATIGGASIIEDGCWISPGVTINDHVTMKANSKAGTGSVLIKDTLENSFYLGNPARKISERID